MARAATLRVEVRPAMLRWARERARLDLDDLARRFPKLAEWEDERTHVRPTLKQLEDFAKATHAPIGYLFYRSRRSNKSPSRISAQSRIAGLSVEVPICSTRSISANSGRNGITILCAERAATRLHRLSDR